MIWLVIWVRFWVEWTFKYTQLPCHAFWEYLKIFFSYCKILWCPKWGSYSITSFEDSSRVKAKNTDMPNCNLSCKRKFNVHFNFGFFGHSATADVFIFRVIYESPLFVENSIFPVPRISLNNQVSFYNFANSKCSDRKVWFIQMRHFWWFSNTVIFLENFHSNFTFL